MNYSKNLRKAAMGKRVIILLCVATFLGLVVGGLLGYVLKSHITTKDEENRQIPINELADTETLVYGVYDDRCFTEEVSLDWGAGTLDFKPLDCGMDEELQEFIYYLSAGYNIDFTLAMAIIQHESNFKANVVSGTNDYGLMQINKMNHQYLTDTVGITDFLDPYQNTRAGLYILRKLFEKYEDPAKVLMAYNMGETGAKKLWGKGIFETDYTNEVLKNAAAFTAEIERMNEND